MKIIKPDYTKEHKCYYCGINKAVPNKEYPRILTKIVGKGFPLAVSYIQVDVRVPRCEKCEKRHDIAERPSCILFIAGIIIGICLIIYLIVFKATNFNLSYVFANWFGIICSILGVLSIWALVCFVVGNLLRVIINAFMKGTKDERDDDEYPPVKKLLDIGFIKQKPDAAAQYGTTVDNDKQKLQNTLISIINNDNCIISDSKQHTKEMH